MMMMMMTVRKKIAEDRIAATIRGRCLVISTPTNTESHARRYGLSATLTIRGADELLLPLDEFVMPRCRGISQPSSARPMKRARAQRQRMHRSRNPIISAVIVPPSRPPVLHHSATGDARDLLITDHGGA